VLDDMLSVGPDGRLLFREALISTARQQGKSVLLSALAGWWATEQAVARCDPQTVLLMANKLDRAMDAFTRLAVELEAQFGAKARIGNNNPSITLADGSRILPKAAKAYIHGLSLDLALIDEVWDISPEVIYGAISPSQIARRDPMMAMFSTAGDASSVAMLGIREKALMAIDSGKRSRLYFAEWSMPPGIDPEDRRWWVWSNPALGLHAVDWDALEAKHETQDRATFMRSHLNLWITSASSWLPIGLWERQQTQEPMPAGGVLAVDSSVDDARFIGVRSQARADGVQVLTEFVVATEAEMWAQVGRVLADPAVKLLVTPGIDLHVPLPLRKRTQTVGQREMMRDTSLVRTMITEGRVWHSGQNALSEHVNRAVAVKAQNGLVLSSQRSPGPIEMARCLVWSVAVASVPVSNKRAAFAAV
jgi:phage terminase large subunit-like protein